ncbi:MAG: ferredoxin [Desulfobulbus sp.]|nr:ferredoxin [Desulfobulbus sp.]
MKIVTEQEVREETVHAVARKMMAAARTAPKAKGVDNLVIALFTREDIAEISAKMIEMARRDSLPDVFLRDAVNILSAQAMVAFGTRIAPLGVSPCGMCGFADCEEKKKHPDHPCVFNTGDLGIAIGSAASVAMDNRIDNRVMFTVGRALLAMGVFGEEVKIVYAMPLSISGKNPFMDRNHEALVKKA